MAKKKSVLKKVWGVLTSPRFTSFYWRTGIMVATATVNLLIENLSGSGLSPAYTVLAGLVLGEISKALANVYIADKPAGFSA